MSGINKVILIGNLGSDPETRDVNGRTVCNFSLATSESWTDNNGQKQEKTQWHRVTVWGKLAELCGQYLAKGRKVYVEGRLNYRDAEKDGVSVRYTDIVASSVQFLSPKAGDNSQYQYGGGNDADIPF